MCMAPNYYSSLPIVVFVAVQAQAKRAKVRFHISIPVRPRSLSVVGPSGATEGGDSSEDLSSSAGRSDSVMVTMVNILDL